MSFTPTDIQLFQGSFAQFDFQVTDGNGNAIDLRTYTILSQVKTQPGQGGSILGQFDVQDIGLSAGMFRLWMSASATKSFPDPLNVPGRPYYVASWDVFVAPTATSGTYDQQYASGRAFIYPRSSMR